MNKNKKIPNDPFIIRHLINKYIEGKSYDKINQELSNKYNVNVCIDTVFRWFRNCKKLFDLDELKEKNYRLSINQAKKVSMFMEHNNYRKEHNTTDFMKRRIINLNRTGSMK